MAIRHLAAALLLVSSSAVVGAQEAPIAGDLARLQGKWSTYLVYADGSKHKIVLEFKGDRVRSTLDDPPADQPTGEQRVILNENASPKTLDAVEARFVNGKPGPFLEKLKLPDILAIYELNGDTLKFASSPFSNKRPKAFATSSDTVYAVYTRGPIPKEVTTPSRPAGSAAMKAVAPVVEGDLAELQGTWTTGTGMFHGPGREIMTIRGDDLVVVGRPQKGAEARYQSRIKLDETTSPRSIDFLTVKNGSKPGQNARGIYELNGESLTIHRSGPGRPRSSVFKNGSEAGRVAVWTRGTVVVSGSTATGTGRRPAPGAGNAMGPAVGQFFKGLTVVSFTPRNVVFQTADGGKVEATIIGAKGHDIDGKPVGRGDELMRAGNVVDATIAPIPTSKIGMQEIKEFRLVRGEKVAVDPGTEGGTLNDAEVKIFPYRVTFIGEGKEMHAFKRNPNAKAFDVNGEPLPKGSADRMLKEGNRVAVVLSRKIPRELYSRILEIRLLQGELLEPSK